MGRVVQLVGAVILVTAMALLMYRNAGPHGCQPEAFFTLKGTTKDCQTRVAPKIEEAELVAELAKE